MIYALIFAILGALSYWYWRTRFIPKEVRQNAADFDADGANDSLQQGYHQRRTWARIWPALACCVVPSLPLLLGEGVWGGVLAFLAMVALIGGAFARYFTPQLNLARSVKRPDITEFYASPDSKSWPDAKIWVALRRAYPGFTNQQLQAKANRNLRLLLTRTWLQCRIAAAILATAAAWVAVAH